MKQPGATISTMIYPSDDPQLVTRSLESLFPDLEIPDIDEKSFPLRNKSVEWIFEEVDLTNFINRISELRILDTALDAMSANIHRDETIFKISRQAALANKVAFALSGEKLLGGVIEISIKGSDLTSWLEEATWHEGRNDWPRSVRDEFSMKRDGKVVEWLDKRENN
tara:strand:+ start:127 stop:627 length:501 start_codon:yes stop_codon:yes gene_type:complete